ncbi:hypothetical protein [Flavobacterium tructae]|uniref:hypothetical protein n=1 Tax=Flavobacterium tructae TaxID=1114873 RepID=UPI0035A85C19
MSLDLISVVNASIPNKEFVLLQANTEMNLQGYAIVDRTFNGQQVSNEFRHIFVFPNLDVAKGDFVKLFTGEDDYKNYKNEGGTYTHELFWQSSKCVWNDNGKDRASLIQYKHIGSADVKAM